MTKIGFMTTTQRGRQYLFAPGIVAGQVRARMEERLDERERIARDLHDTLL
jgi:signal transduction histidine kinase